MKIIDAFIFYNELDLLDYRLNILNDVIDYFIIVESLYTFTGNKKELYYNSNKDKFINFNHKIINIITDMPYIQPTIDINKNEQWFNETYQRNCIKFGIDELNLDDNDIIIISDLDEIPDPNTLLLIKKNNIYFKFANLQQDLYYYNLNCKHNNKWEKSKILSYETYKKLKDNNILCDDIRLLDGPSIVIKGGWHLSTFGNINFILNKIKNFSHQELNNEKYTDQDYLKYCIENNIFYGNFNDDKCIKLPIHENTYLPPYCGKYLKKYICI